MRVRVVLRALVLGESAEWGEKGTERGRNGTHLVLELPAHRGEELDKVVDARETARDFGNLEDTTVESRGRFE